MNPKTAIFLSVRDKATRLPYKVKRLIKGKSVIEHLINRLKRANLPEHLIITTSVNIQDQWLLELADREHIDAFAGSEEDKLQRYLDAALHYRVEFFVVVDGDDLFCDPGFIDGIIECYFTNHGDYISYQNLPLGVTGFGVKTAALEKIVRLKKEKNTEVWGGYFLDTLLFNTHLLDPPLRYRRPHIRMTLDYPEDLQFFEHIFEGLYHPHRYMSLDKILNYLDDHPDILRINQDIQARYVSNLKDSLEKVRKDIKHIQEMAGIAS